MVNVSSAREKARIAAAKAFEASVHHALGLELIGEWKLDTPGGSAPDSSGFNRHGTSVGIPNFLTGANCIWGGCYFTSNPRYFDLGTDDFQIGTSDFTVGFWIKTSAVDPFPVHVLEDGSSASSIGFEASISSGKVGCLLNDGSGALEAYPSTTVVSDSRWHYITLFFDRNDKCKLYIDGKASGPGADISGKQLSISNGTVETIGWNYAGSVDQVRLYKAIIDNP